MHFLKLCIATYLHNRSNTAIKKFPLHKSQYCGTLVPIINIAPTYGLSKSLLFYNELFSNNSLFLYWYTYCQETDFNPHFKHQHAYASAGTYITSLLVTNGICTTMVYDTLVILLTEINYHEDVSTLMIIPNPFQTNVTISYNLSSGNNISLDVIDVTGKLVNQMENNTSQLPGKYSYIFSNSVSGMYFVRFKVGNTITMRKVVKTD